MKLHYTGRLEPLDAVSQKKLDARLVKLGKLLDRRSEKEAHVILKTQRHLRHAEITVNYYDHPLAGEHAATDSLSALLGACDKLEKQLLKLQTKRRDKRRNNVKPVQASSSEPVAAPPAEPGPRVYRVNSKDQRKPMTVDEAILEISNDRGYLVYRDSETERLSVLIRRPDGHFDLIEA
jgi:putative sigma-54 modulation protein